METTIVVHDNDTSGNQETNKITVTFSLRDAAIAVGTESGTEVSIYTNCYRLQITSITEGRIIH